MQAKNIEAEKTGLYLSTTRWTKNALKRFCEEAAEMRLFVSISGYLV